MFAKQTNELETDVKRTWHRTALHSLLYHLLLRFVAVGAAEECSPSYGEAVVPLKPVLRFVLPSCRRAL